MLKALFHGSATKAEKRYNGLSRIGSKKTSKSTHSLKVCVAIIKGHPVMIVNTIRSLNPSVSKEKIKQKNWGSKDIQCIHKWVKYHKGTPQICEKCKKTNEVRYEWANKDHRYKRNLNDYIRLCSKCHRKNDLKFLNYKHICKMCGIKFESKCKKSEYCPPPCRSSHYEKFVRLKKV